MDDDSDDENADVAPSLPELCSEDIDEDCDGVTSIADCDDSDCLLACIDNDGDGWIDIVLSYDRKNATLVLQTREELQETWSTQLVKIDGEIIDYSGSHVWVGCANAFASCPEPQFYSGHVRCLGVFNSVLTEKYRDKFYKEYQDFRGIAKYFRGHAHRRQVYNFEEMKPLAFTNFKTSTPYKAYDFSGNGNHPIIYKREWGVY